MTPPRQYLYPEIRLFERMFARFGTEAVIADARELIWREGRLWHGAQPVELVYNRLTDFYLEEPAHAALRAAYEAGRGGANASPSRSCSVRRQAQSHHFEP